ncbi:MAG: hypothetical protein C5B58_11820 [Acidobacteria bacterium]|nr:MAG: hypothetical protein C5B58_11820 [Acidobacteriota bacterium]
MEKTFDQFLELVKFRLLTKPDISSIEEEIEKIVAEWSKRIDKTGRTSDALRERLYTLLREGMAEDKEAGKKRRH